MSCSHAYVYGRRARQAVNSSFFSLPVMQALDFCSLFPGSCVTTLVTPKLIATRYTRRGKNSAA